MIKVIPLHIARKQVEEEIKLDKEKLINDINEAVKKAIKTNKKEIRIPLKYYPNLTPIIRQDIRNQIENAGFDVDLPSLDYIVFFIK